MAEFVRQFQKSVRTFRSLRAEVFLIIVQSIHREKVFADLLSDGADPVYHGVVPQQPFHTNL